MTNDQFSLSRIVDKLNSTLKRCALLLSRTYLIVYTTKQHKLASQQAYVKVQGAKMMLYNFHTFRAHSTQQEFPSIVKFLLYEKLTQWTKVE